MREIQEKFPGILQDEPLRKYCTFLIGGLADYFYKAKTTKDLSEILQFAHKKGINYFIMGGGSNILFDDQGFRGLVIKNEASKISIKGTNVTADSGTIIAKLLMKTLENRLSGLEKWVGLPGTVGGAVRGNAGCNGLETSEILKSATLFDPKTGEVKEVKNSYFNYAYRYSKLKETNEVVLDATFKLKKATISTEEQKRIMAEISQFRLTAQPFGLSSGSFFKNPIGNKPAGFLIDQAGIKGKTIGKAQISEKHGNFFLNLGGATASDIIELAKFAKAAVRSQFGIELEEEVQILNQNGPIKLENGNIA